jgi:hypothetical protein
MEDQDLQGAMRLELHAILDAIAAQMGQHVAQHAALTLRAALLAGRIDGGTFWRNAGDLPSGCIAGWLGFAIGRDVAFEDLPGWEKRDERGCVCQTPIERFSHALSREKRQGDCTRVGELADALDAWERRETGHGQ